MQRRKESLPLDGLPTIASLQSRAGVYTKHAQEGEMLPSPHRLPQCGKNHGPKNNQAYSGLCAKNPDESSGIHFLMIESGPDCIIFSIMENITLHHNCNMFQARLYNALMKWACGLGLKSPDKSTGAVCVCVRARTRVHVFTLCNHSRVGVSDFIIFLSMQKKMTCIPLSRSQSEKAESRYAQYSSCSCSLLNGPGFLIHNWTEKKRVSWFCVLHEMVLFSTAECS